MPKLYALLARCERQRGRLVAALAACRKGSRLFPDDAELLFEEAVLCRASGDLPAAEAALLRLLGGRARPGFERVDPGLRGYRGRHALAGLYLEQGRPAEAEAQWRAAVAERPDFAPAWVGLAELYLAQQRRPDLEAVLGRLESLPQAAAEAAALRARGRGPASRLVPEVPGPG